MSVFNGEKFLREAIDSILNQTYKNFEFIIINDGSTDNSINILKSYTDDRIIIIDNIENKGLIYSLNKGIEVAKGEYIARMDSDDISLSNRFEIQLQYFNNQENIAVVCSPIISITESGNITKPWLTDLENDTESKIKNTLPKDNCIAHPSVMINTAIAKKYKYNFNQKGSEDWDLWLRLISDNHRIVKTKELLLKYRFLNTSITRTDNVKQSVEIKTSKVQFNFILNQLLQFKLSITILKASYALLRSLARFFKINYIEHFARTIKRLITINPIKAFTQYSKLKNVSLQKNNIDLFFMFPYSHIGGAEKVHANIVEVFHDKKCIVYFTGISNKQDFLYLFEKHALCLNVGSCINHPFFSKKSHQLILNNIHSQTKPVVFGCNNLYFYNTILQFNKNVRVFDLMHDFRFEQEDNITHHFEQQYYRCEKRIFISKKAIQQTILFYDFKSAPKEEYDKLKLITNYVDFPIDKIEKDFDATLEVLFVGRGTLEKRAHLVGEIAKQCHLINPSINFTAIGNLEEVISPENKSYLNLTGDIFDFEKIKPYYKKAHIILITSEREGFPLVIMEGMAYGLVPISSPVGDIPDHVSINNGFITSSIKENSVVKEIAHFIFELESNRKLLKTKSNHSYEYAKNQFSKAMFENAYKEVINL